MKKFSLSILVISIFSCVGSIDKNFICKPQIKPNVSEISESFNQQRRIGGLLELDHSFSLDTIKYYEEQLGRISYSSDDFEKTGKYPIVQEEWSKKLGDSLVVKKYIYYNLNDLKLLVETDNYFHQGLSDREELSYQINFDNLEFSAKYYSGINVDKMEQSRKKTEDLINNTPKGSYICGYAIGSVIFDGLVTKLSMHKARKMIKEWSR